MSLSYALSTQRVDLLTAHLSSLESELELARSSQANTTYSLSWLLSLLHSSTSSSATSLRPSNAYKPLPAANRFSASGGLASPPTLTKPAFRVRPSSLTTATQQAPSQAPILSPPSSPTSSADTEDTMDATMPGQIDPASHQSSRHRQRYKTNGAQGSSPNHRVNGVGWLAGVVWRDLVMIPVQLGWAIALMPVRIGLWTLRKML